MKNIKIGLWILLFPIMLLIYGIKKKKKALIIIGTILTILFLIYCVRIPGDKNNISGDVQNEHTETNKIKDDEKNEENDKFSNTEDANKVDDELSYIEDMSFSDDNLYMHVIDVGQNEAVYIGYEDFDMVIDGGGDGNYLVDYLQNQGVDDIELMIATHIHADHISGLDEIIKAFKVDKIIHSGDTHDTIAYNNFITAAKEEGQNVLYGDKDETIIVNDNLFIEIIEIGDGYDEANNNSVITRVVYKEKSILLSGDIEEKIEKLLSSKNISADIFLANHHGSSTSNSFTFLNAVKPEYIVISASEDNNYGHPHKEALSNMLIFTENIYGTWLSGDIIFELSQNGEIKINTNVRVKNSDGKEYIDNSYSPTSNNLTISELNKKDEYVIITNYSDDDINMSGWELESALGRQKFFFPSFVLKSGESVKVGDSNRNEDVDFHWYEGNGIWNNLKMDPCRLYDTYSKLIDERK